MIIPFSVLAVYNGLKWYIFKAMKPDLHVELEVGELTLALQGGQVDLTGGREGEPR